MRVFGKHRYVIPYFVVSLKACQLYKMAEIAERAFQKFYPKLSEVLPISSIVTDFYSQGLLAGDHKANIDALDTQKRKAEYFLDYVIKPGLKVGYTGQFDKMLRVMEISDDPAVQFVVGEIRKFSEMSREPETPPKQDLTADLRRTAGKREFVSVINTQDPVE